MPMYAKLLITISTFFLVNLAFSQTINQTSSEYVKLLNDNYSLQSKNNLIDAERAYSAKNSQTLTEILSNEKDLRVKELINYWIIMLQGKNISKNEIEAAIDNALSNNIKSWLASSWVNIAGTLEDYGAIRKYFPHIRRPSSENKCNYAIAMDKAGVSDELKNMRIDSFIDNLKPGIACRNLHSLLVEKRIVNNQEINFRLNQNIYNNNSTEFYKINIASYPNEISERSFFSKGKALKAAIKKSIPNNISKATRALYQDALVHFGIAQIRNDKNAGENFYLDNKKHLSANSKKTLCAFLSHAFSNDFDSRAINYANCGLSAINTTLSPPQIEDILRYHLRQNRWQEIISILDNSPISLQEDIAWVYWRARAILALEKFKLTPQIANSYLEEPQGKNEKILSAINGLASIRFRPDFYGALANEYFGNSPDIPEFTIKSTEEEINKIAKSPCFNWASTLISMGGRIRSVGTFEWIHCVEAELNTDREKLAAAHYALRQNIYDRAINTAILTTDEHDWRLRFITPFYNEVSKGAKEQNVPLELIYGLVRQESRFIIDAHSVAGAKGLMQIMPKTGRWLAKKLEVSPYNNSMLNETPLNVFLGTSYMRMIFDKSNHPVLMCASYNAGPSRATRWMRGENQIDAVAYTESIPFNETRGYVKNVLWNTTIYQKILGKADAKISDWLYPITSLQLLSNVELP